MANTSNGLEAPAEEFWQAKQVSEYTGIPEGTLRYWVHTGRGPKSFTLGPRRRVWRKSVVLAWIAEQESVA
ncbi:helix-turn-helix domain-containing protein [Rhodococcus pyridinivorans]|uniref:helix-turn-helix transcriptional regulator n=1 Tax=Rhodococcus pyridinivorans TaxID=103816 RepID=UPI0020C6F7A1|nr:helix-turn-helix domain-containing protein [Rhodococcus pyridinivorans]UTM38315.1 helix-turn-helix domain-containing protein [Rhodococcus pyridinivorans]